MDVSPVLVAALQAPEAVEPGERPFDHPPVASQAVLGLDTTAGDAGALARGQTGPCAECGQSGEAFGGRDREEVLREAAERAAKEPHVVLDVKIYFSSLLITRRHARLCL